jgi:hypothetical protein
MGNSTCPGTSVLTWTILGLDIINNPQKSEMEEEGVGKGRMKLGDR